MRNFRANGFPRPFPDAARVLSELRSRNLKLAVISSHMQAFLEEEAGQFFGDYRRFFTGIFGSVHDKEAAISGILSAAGFKPDETLIVGDTEHDIKAGKRAGLKTAAILTGYRSRGQLLTASPDAVLESLSALLELV